MIVGAADGPALPAQPASQEDGGFVRERTREDEERAERRRLRVEAAAAEAGTRPRTATQQQQPVTDEEDDEESKFANLCAPDHAEPYWREIESEKKLLCLLWF